MKYKIREGNLPYFYNRTHLNSELNAEQQKITFHSGTNKVYFESGTQISGSGNGWSTSLYNNNGNRYTLMANPNGLYFSKYSSDGEPTEIWRISV